MKLIARMLAILAAALVVVGITFGLNQSSGAQAAERPRPSEVAQNASASGASATTSAQGRPARGPGGEHNDSASLFGIVEVLKNLAIIAIITAVVSQLSRFMRRNPRKDGPRPHAPPA